MERKLLTKDILPLQAYVAYGIVLWGIFIYCLHGAFIGEVYFPSRRGRDYYFTGFITWLFPIIISVMYIQVRIAKDKFLSPRASRVATTMELTLLLIAVGSAWFFANKALSTEENILSGSRCEKYAQAAGISATFRIASKMTGEEMDEKASFELAKDLAESFKQQLGTDRLTAFALAAYPIRAQIHPNLLSDRLTHRHLFYNICRADLYLPLVAAIDRRKVLECYEAAYAKSVANKQDACIVDIFPSISDMEPATDFRRFITEYNS